MFIQGPGGRILENLYLNRMHMHREANYSRIEQNELVKTKQAYIYDQFHLLSLLVRLKESDLKNYSGFDRFFLVIATIPFSQCEFFSKKGSEWPVPPFLRRGSRKSALVLCTF